MKTIICGAGDVGYSIADRLSKESFEVTVLDKDEERSFVFKSDCDLSESQKQWVQ